MPESVDFKRIIAFCREAYSCDSLIRSQLSSLLKIQLYFLEMQGYGGFYLRRAVQDIDNNVLESAGMKPDTEFQRPPLKGLWKKHVFDPVFETQNIKSELVNEHSKTSDDINRLFREHSGEPFQNIKNELIDIVIFKSMQNRRELRTITGEWIIYAKSNGKTYLLSLANHKEGRTQKEGDSHIYHRLYRCCRGEFPFLFPMTQSNSE